MQRAALQRAYLDVRQHSEALCQPLTTEDYVVQPVAYVSPPKWHLGHVSWFFETFLLQPYVPGYQPYHPRYTYLFNSYYHHVGARWARAKRGDLSRPTVQEIYAYRRAIDDSMLQFLESVDGGTWEDVAPRFVLGLHHEQQHQELLLTDIKYILAMNPLQPVYHAAPPAPPVPTVSAARFVPFAGGLYRLGHEDTGFCFDNEQPAHTVFVSDFVLHERLVTNGEYLDFMADGGYRDFRHWLSNGWDMVQREGWEAPLYWLQQDGVWHEATLQGVRAVDRQAPVTHVSYYEAAAYASWAQHRLPTEAEWEVAARLAGVTPCTGNFVEDKHFHPQPARPSAGTLSQMLGDVWEWTGSAYLAYPGYRPAAGALGEYNGKFMVDQMVLRGGSCATPRDHIRTSYRNFFHASERWQFTGIRLADDA